MVDARALRAVVVGGVLATAGLVAGVGPGPPAQSAEAATGASSRTVCETPPDRQRRCTQIDQSADLTDQRVTVRWRGFWPTVFQGSRAEYLQVDVLQCPAEPVTPADCYGFPDPGTSETIVIESPDLTRYRTVADMKVWSTSNSADQDSNAVVHAVTAPDGTGEASIEVRTALQAPKLGCSAVRACSLAVVPIETTTGRNEISAYDFERALVAPLAFAPTPLDCPPDAEFDVRAAGSATAAAALTQWAAGLCTAVPPLTVDYTFEGAGGPAGREAFLAGTVDAAVTSEPVTEEERARFPHARPHMFAPLALNGVVIAFVLDKVRTDGAGTYLSVTSYTSMKLTPRLVAKMLSGSYSARPDAKYEAVWQDPEFKKINPGIRIDEENPPSRHQPLLRAEGSDSTTAITRWVMADEAARAFLAGRRDETGMVVNPAWKGVPWPTDRFTNRDPNTYLRCYYNPMQGLTKVAQSLAVARPNSVPECDSATANRVEPQPVGGRALFAVMDAATAGRYQFPVAALRNPAGAFVAPSHEALSAAAEAMDPRADGILEPPVPPPSAAGAYAVPKVEYAMVATRSASAASADGVARLLDHAAGSGQTTGRSPGNLDPGYGPLPEELRTATRAAAAAVRAGTPTPASRTPTPTPTSSPTSVATTSASPAAAFGSTGTSTSASSTPHPAPALSPAAAAASRAGAVTPPTPSNPAALVRTVSQTSMRPATFAEPAGRWLLPALLGTGLAAVLLVPLIVGWQWRRPRGGRLARTTVARRRSSARPGP